MTHTATASEIHDSILFSTLNAALLSCTNCHLSKERDEDGELAYALRDGCGDVMGDLFDELYDVQEYITNNDEVLDYLVNV